jgi:FkbM family methyltransferase
MSTSTPLGAWSACPTEMVDVKVSTCTLTWPWARQTPGRSFHWEGVRFHVDCEVDRCDAWVVFQSLDAPQSTNCPPNRTVFITGEPDPIGRYDNRFLAQFARVVTSRTDIEHPGLVRRQQGHPWFIEKTYDELCAMPPVQKIADVCLITSDKVFTEGHRERLQFALDLKARLAGRIDLWGRGLQDFSSTWDVLSRYRYAVTIENHVAHDWLTEKLPDALLAWCVPLYYGCPNVGDYMPAGGWLDMPELNAGLAAEQLAAVLSDPSAYEERLPAIAASRRRYLDHLQFFANIAEIVRGLDRSAAHARVQLYPEGAMPQLVVPPAEPEPNGIERKLAGALRLTGWRLLHWAEELRPLPAEKPVPAPPPTDVASVAAAPSLREVAQESWERCQGERTLRLDYAMAPGDIVLDIGGFEGQWASDIFGTSLCTVHVFEPVPPLAEAIRRRFAGNPHMEVHAVAIGAADGTLQVAVDGEEMMEVPMRRFVDVVGKYGWQEIALMKVNVEGGEYELLEHVLDTGLISRIRHLQVKFHDFVPNAHKRMLALQARLRATHEMSYYFPFVWESWQRKDSAR